ncbi:MAG: cation:proton antiporter, partial [Methylococcus sp.]
MSTVVNPAASAESLLFHTLLQLIFIILAARVTGSVFVRLKQPRGVGEIEAGLLLGPSLFGTLAPESFHWLFQVGDPGPLHLLSQIGLILLMFQVGMEFDFTLLGNRANRRVAALVTVMGILIPGLCGWGFGQLSAHWLAPGISVPAYSLFIAVALSITAVPILGRILMDFGLTRHRIGVISIAAAAANDALGWVLLAAVSAVATHGFESYLVLRQVGLLLIYLLVSWFLLRPLLLRLIRLFPLESGRLPQNLLALLLIWVFASALVTSRLGIFAIFGGFVAGVLLHQAPELVQAWRQRVGDLLAVFFLPIFFTYTGLRTDVGSLITGEDWL